MKNNTIAKLTITTLEFSDGEMTFEVVEKIPTGFKVWNIPPIGNGEYIPIRLVNL